MIFRDPMSSLNPRHSPHSGRHCPADFGSALPEAVLRRAEDAYVDETAEGW